MNKKAITSIELRYLKAVAKDLDVKITVIVRERFPYVYMHDYEFKSFEHARWYLAGYAQTVVDYEKEAKI